MSAVDIMTLMVPVTYLAFLGLEALAPARQFPPAKGWRWLGVGFLILGGMIQAVTPLLIPAGWLAAHRLFDLSGLGVAGGAVVGYLVLSFVSYLWHRSAHRFGFMWRTFHQIHHSPQRVDMSGSQLFHPLETLAFALMGVAVTTLVLGLDPLAAAITGYVAAFYGMFQHLNLKTPQWLGVIIQRPEAHCLHHGRGVHGFNYADLPVWDMLFGSWRNPKTYEGECGFDAPADRRLGAMLAFADVNAPINGAGSLGRARPQATTGRRRI